MKPFNPKRIRHVDQLLPRIERREEFIHVDKGDYSVIDYRYVAPDSFDDHMRLECRGIKFAPDGRILARPFHKFFNVGERLETQPGTLDWSRPHIVLDKLDGSMIHQAMVDGEIVLMTRMGVTNVAEQAMAWASTHCDPSFWHMLEDATDMAMTLMFEFTSPANRIVVPYTETKLTLIGARHNVTGEYVGFTDLVELANSYRVPFVRRAQDVPPTREWARFEKHARGLIGKEGYVVRFIDGGMVKIKGDDYVLKHRTKENMQFEKNVLACVLDGIVDDVLTILDPDVADVLRAYEQKINRAIEINVITLNSMASSAKDTNHDRKEYAEWVADDLSPPLRPPAFLVFDGQDADEVIRFGIRRACGIGQKKVEQMIDLVGGVRWSDFYDPENLREDISHK